MPVGFLKPPAVRIVYGRAAAPRGALCMDTVMMQPSRLED
jgi:hypothetical protein